MKRIFLLIILVMIAGVIWFYASASSEKMLQTVVFSEIKSEEVEVTAEEKVGQLFMIGHWAHTPVASTTELIKKHHIGGVIIMSAPDDALDIKNWAAEWNSVSKTPLLIAIDQEGGPVTRLKGEQFIQTGQRDIMTEKQAYEVGLLRGQELATLGININFAPVLDTANDPESFMYERVFPDQSKSATLAAAMQRGMDDAGVVAVPKHFPGHDDTSDDSHFTLPSVDIERDELDEFILPFKKLLEIEQPEMIMTAHVFFPKISEKPATLSYFFLTEYLRDELGYEGIIITDDMSMDAIDSNWSSEEASVMALAAGADIILFAAEPHSVSTAINAVTDLVKNSKLDIEQSYLKNTAITQ